MRKSVNLYPNAGWWFLLLIPLVAVGFYPTYFAVLFKPAASIIHIHFILMTIWVIILVIQPFLFRYKKLALHRQIGRFTFFFVPLLLVSSFLMIRLSYFRFLASPQGLGSASRQAVMQTAATFMAIAFLYLGLLALFYTLAVINRHKAAAHARYMVAAALTLLGPTVDRIVFSTTGVTRLGGTIPIETVAFAIADGILVFLLWKDYKARRPLRTLFTCLGIYLLAQLSYFLFKDTEAWAGFVTFVMQVASG